MGSPPLQPGGRGNMPAAFPPDSSGRQPGTGGQGPLAHLSLPSPSVLKKPARRSPREVGGRAWHADGSGRRREGSRDPNGKGLAGVAEAAALVSGPPRTGQEASTPPQNKKRATHIEPATIPGPLSPLGPQGQPPPRNLETGVQRVEPRPARLEPRPPQRGSGWPPNAGEWARKSCVPPSGGLALRGSPPRSPSLGKI